MSDTENMSRETHEALLDKALREATADSSKQLDEAQAKLAGLESEKAGLEEANASLKTENAELSTKLDEAQVALKSAQDKVTELEGVIAKRDEAAKVAEIASARAEQVKKLGLFNEEYIAEKAQAWAGVSEEDAHVYAEGVRRGGTLLTVRVPDARRAEIDGILANSSFVDVRNRAAQFRQGGWNRFDERSPRLTEDEIRRERERYGQI